LNNNIKSGFKTELPMRTVCDSKFQRDGAENWKVRLEKYVHMNGWDGR